MRYRLAALGILAVAGLTASARDRTAQKRDCACISLEAMPERLKNVVSLNWRQLDRSTITREWPEAPVLPCEFADLTKLNAVIDRCSKTGRVAGYLDFEAGFSTSVAPPQEGTGLWGIEVYLSRRSKQEILSALGELVAAVVSKHPVATYVYGWSASDGSDQAIYAARWGSGQDTFVLEASVFAAGGKWRGGFTLRRRPLAEVGETWTLDDGSQVRVLRNEIQDYQHPPARVLRLAYLTDCLIADQSCLGQEVTRLWPRIRARVERERIRRVFVTIVDGAGASTTIFPRRRADGEWDVLPWKRH
ncbi:MAG: hypothetical protein ABSD56_09740 [Bryobacteraceae bacterium]